MKSGILQSALWRRYATVLTVLLASALLALGGIEMAVAYRSTLDSARAAQQQTATEVAYAIGQSLGVTERQLLAVAALPWQQGGWLGDDQRLEEFHRLLLLVPALLEIRLLDAAGQTLLRASRLEPDQRVAGLPAPATAAASAPEQGGPPARAPANNGPFAPRFEYGPVRYKDDYEPRLEMAMLVGDRTAARTEATLGLRALASELQQVLTVPGMEVFVVNSEAVVVLHAEPTVMLSRKTWPGAANEQMGLAGRVVLSAQAAVPRLGWQVVVERDRVKAMATVSRALWRTATFTAAAVALALAVSMLLAGRLVRPIARLHAAASRLSEGHLDTRITLQTRDELEDLAHQFNRMAASLQANVSELEDRVAKRTIELTEANRHKDEFLAGMSHELRTPLNGILGFADVLREGMAGPLNDEQREYLDDIHRSGLLLLSLINDLLDQARLASGKLPLDRADFDITETLDMAAAVMRRDIDGQSQTLHLDVQAGMPPWHADARRIKQVVLNLLGNAAKFTPAGGRLDLRAGMAVDGNAWLEVQDTGPGIAPENHELIFHWGQQVTQGTDSGPATASPDSSGATSVATTGATTVFTTARSAGLGLGLALVRGIVRAHGGDVTVRSALGQGATFRVTLPQARPAAPPAYPADERNSAP